MKKTIPLPDRARLRALFDYSEDTFEVSGQKCVGGLIWRLRHDRLGRPNIRYVGKFAGTYSARNHRVQVAIDRRVYDAARVIWAWHYGAMPEGALIDHADRNPMHNAVGNLRLADYSGNNANRTPNTGSTSSRYLGVYLNRYGRWAAQIKKDSKVIYLGQFDFEETAARVRDEASVALFGEFAVLNFPEAPHASQE